MFIDLQDFYMNLLRELRRRLTCLNKVIVLFKMILWNKRKQQNIRKSLRNSNSNSYYGVS